VEPDVQHRTRHALFIHPGKLTQADAVYTAEAEHNQRELLLTYYIDILMFSGYPRELAETSAKQALSILKVLSIVPLYLN
jgi:hypothetical protein